MEEKEIKLLLKISLERFKKRILKKGYLKTKILFQTDFYFDTPDWKLYYQLAALRLRGKTLSYKQLSRQKNKWYVEEKEVLFDNPGLVADILCSLGFYQAITIKKRRIVFTKNQNEIVIDKIKGLGTVIEMECKKDDPLTKIKEILKDDEWERTVEGTSNLWLRINKGFTFHLTAFD